MQFLIRILVQAVFATLDTLEPVLSRHLPHARCAILIAQRVIKQLDFVHSAYLPMPLLLAAQVLLPDVYAIQATPKPPQPSAPNAMRSAVPAPLWTLVKHARILMRFRIPLPISDVFAILDTGKVAPPVCPALASARPALRPVSALPVYPRMRSLYSRGDAPALADLPIAPSLQLRIPASHR